MLGHTHAHGIVQVHVLHAHVHVHVMNMKMKMNMKINMNMNLDLDLDIDIYIDIFKCLALLDHSQMNRFCIFLSCLLFQYVFTTPYAKIEVSKSCTV